MPDNKFKVGDKVIVTVRDITAGLEVGDIRPVLKTEDGCVLLEAPDGWWSKEQNAKVWWMGGNEIEPWSAAAPTSELDPQFAVTRECTAFGENLVSFFDTIEEAEGYALSLDSVRWVNITILQRIAKVEAKPVLVR